MRYTILPMPTVHASVSYIEDIIEQDAIEGLLRLDPEFDALFLPNVDDLDTLTELPVLPESPVKRRSIPLPLPVQKYRKAAEPSKKKSCSWTEEADNELIRLVSKHRGVTTHLWQHVYAEFAWAQQHQLSTKQLFSRYHVIHPNYKHGTWGSEQDHLLIDCLNMYRNQFIQNRRWPWSDIGNKVGRSPAQCKNRYNSALRSAKSTKMTNRKKNGLYVWMITQPWILAKN